MSRSMFSFKENSYICVRIKYLMTCKTVKLMKYFLPNCRKWKRTDRLLENTGFSFKTKFIDYLKK